MNLFGLLGQLGLSWEHHRELLFPIGTVYDAFVCRGLDALIYGTYSGSRFIVVGTPSGVTLAPEGGAHQSTITPSIGHELPGIVYAKPAYAQTLDWLLCDGLDLLMRPDGESLYLRLSTQPIDQTPLNRCLERLGHDRLRRDVLSGGYRLVERDELARAGAPVVHLFASGAVMPEVVAASECLADEGIAAQVVDVTWADRLDRAWRASTDDASRGARTASIEGTILADLIPVDQRAAPIITVHDASSHALAWLGSCIGSAAIAVGVDAVGQSGSVDQLYRHFGLSRDWIVNAALVALAPESPDYASSSARTGSPRHTAPRSR